TSRSAKVTLMEDGILAAPAPYAAPSAYYSPTTGRMAGIEVLKGTSQIKYGPHSTGGTINYISTPIPATQHTYLRGQYGDDNEYRAHAYHGNTVEVAGGRVGYLAEFYLRNTDGFKTIDAAPDFNRTGETGFENIEPMVKLFWEPASPVYQRFEFKYGFTERNADETYLGLATADFRDDANRRYSASRFDNITTEQHRSYLRHFISPTDNFDLVTTAYYNKFARNWYKLNDIRDIGGSGQNLDLSAALAGAAAVTAGDGLACLRGDLACDLRVRANDREYYSYGVQSEGVLRFATGAVAHALTLGVRYHTDLEDRFQKQDVFAQSNAGAITGVTRGAPGSQDNREAEVEAVALWLQDRVELGRWWFTPGIRFETLDLELRDKRPGGGNADESLDLLSGGIAAGYQLTDTWQAFAGVHFGVSPPSPGGAVAGLEEETSVGYELGLRYADTRGVLSAEAVGFYTEFDDLIVVSNIGGTGNGVDENFGEVESYGLELSSAFDLGLAQGWSFSNTYHVAFTWTDATQQNDAVSTDAESIFSFGARGNEVPYIPEYQLNIGSRLDFARWGLSVNATIVDDTFTSANNVDVERNGLGQPDARFGETDAYEIVDLGGWVMLQQHLKAFAGVQNLFDAEYIVSRQPHGARPGLDRTWFVGVEYEM
ncbi:MAG: TonB-dependent receptor, partial [Gammaproteobacteria bacterium]